MSESLIFESERLRCLRWKVSDFSNIFTLYADVEAMRFVDDGHPISEELCKKWLQVTQANYQERGYGMFILNRRESPRDFVGCIGLVHPQGQSCPELKYAFLPKHWGQGLATEAVGALLATASRQFGLVDVCATVHPDNEASQRVLEKARFIEVQPRLNPDGTETLVYERTLGCRH